MLTVISPAKKLDFENPAHVSNFSQSDFLDHSDLLIERARDLSRADLSRLMKISDKLADLNYQRFADFQRPFDTDNAKQAALAFAGDTYVGLDANNLTTEDLDYAQGHLRILSGLYGLLRPLDLMQAYRLEMGTKLDNLRGPDLYAFWRDIIAPAVNEIVKDHQDTTLINLASTEYFKSVDTKSLNGNVLTPVFKEIRNGQSKVIGMMAKRARGSMARYILENRIETIEGIKGFDRDGYNFQADQSDDKNWVFTRDHDMMAAMSKA